MNYKYIARPVCRPGSGKDPDPEFLENPDPDPGKIFSDQTQIACAHLCLCNLW
jgi:hypothetical protein